MTPQPITPEQVLDLCSRGFFPIVKSDSLYADSLYAVFTPFNLADGFRRSSWEISIDMAKAWIGTNNFTIEDKAQPTHLVGFYHPPFTPFKVGDKVRVREDLAELMCAGNFARQDSEYQKTSGTVGIIQSVYSSSYRVEFYDRDYWHYIHNELEPVVELDAPCKVERLEEVKEPTLDGKVAEIEGKKYKLVSVE